MAPNQILRVLKRGWRVLVVFAAIGLILGSASASLSDASESGEYTGIYAASTILRVDGQLSVPVQAATQYLTDPVIAEQVAGDIGGDPFNLAGHVVATSNSELNTIAITAVDVDATRAEQLADGFADAFGVYLTDLEAVKIANTKATTEATSTEIYAKLTEQQSRLDSAAAADKPILQAQFDSLLRQYQLAEDARREAEVRSADSLIALERPALSEPITRENFDAYVQRITGSSSKPGKNQQAPTPSALTLADVLEPSTPPPPPNPLTRGVAGMAAGAMIGVVVLIGLDRVDPRLRSKEQTEEVCGYPVIAEIPPLTRRQRLGTDVLAADEPMSRAAEAYRVLRSAVLFASSAGDGSSDRPTPPNVILVSSPGPSEGKTTSVANLAAVMAEAGYSVLVVNCDFRRPRVHDYLGGVDETRRVAETRIPGVHLVNHVGDEDQLSNPAEMAAAQRRIVRTARDLFDVIILDTAPLLTTNDATELLDLAEVVILVTGSGKTNTASAERAAELLERRRATVLGVVLIGASDVPTARYYYYASDASVGSSGRSNGDGKPEIDLRAELQRVAVNRTPTAES